MTQQAVPENTAVTRADGGRWVGSGNPNGRPKKGQSIRDLIKAIPVSRKRELVKVALEEAIENRDVKWAEWLARYSGESAERPGVIRELIVREYGFDVEALD